MNIDKIQDVRCPTLFVHGEKDQLFPLDQMILLRGHCPGAANIPPVVVKGGAHLGFENHKEAEQEFWRPLRCFIYVLAKMPLHEDDCPSKISEERAGSADTADAAVSADLTDEDD